MTRTNRNLDPNATTWTPSQEEIAASAAVRPVITTADLYAAANPAPEPIKPRDNFSVDGRSIASRSAEAPWQIIYGRARVGGTLAFITTDQGETGEFFHLVIALAGHRIKAVETLYLDGKPIPFDGSPTFTFPQFASGDYAGLVFMGVNLGDVNQAAQPDLVSQSSILFPGKWTVDHRGQGIAHVYLILKFHPSIFANGFPEISFTVQGRDEIYDPRTGLTGYTDNAALCIADYWSNSAFGMNADYENEIDEPVLIDAANTCDETVGLNGGGTEKRYTLNGSFLTSERPGDVFGRMLTAIGGDECVDTMQGKLRLLPKKWRAPSITIDESDIRSSVRCQVKFSRRDTKNAVRGTYIDASNDFQVSDFPEVRNALYLDEDEGVENYIDVAYPFTISAATAQRLAKIDLEEARQPIIVSFVASLRCFLLQVGSIIYLNYARFGWVNKTFRVVNFDAVLDTSGGASIGIPLVLRETAEGVYDWNDGEETLVDLAPNTFLPNPANVRAPENLVLNSGTAYLDIRSDGTIFSRIFAQWTQSDPFVTVSGHHEIQYRKSEETDWRDAPSVPGSSTSTYILDVKDGVAYDVRVRGVNGLGIPSDWITVLSHTVEGKSERPSQIAVLNASVQSFGIHLSWPKINDLDLKAYEIREGSSGWSSAAFVARTSGTSLDLDFRTAGSHTFLIKAIDTSENESLNATAAVVTIAAPSTPTGVFSIDGPDVLLDWDESSGQFAIEKYRVYRGDTFETAELLVETKATAFSVTVDWANVERFYIVAVDVARNTSSPLELDPVVAVPGVVQALRADVFDNNALLKWDPPVTGTLPVVGYRIYRGDTFADAEFIGEVRGTFFAYFELIAGTFTYWVVPIDTASNLGAQSSTTEKISEPPDFVFLDDAQLRPEDFNTLSNVAYDNGILIGPVDTSETWEDHFVNNGWTTIQDQINAGYPIYAQPALLTGYAQEVIDFGVVVPSSLIKLTYASEVISGDVTITPLIEWSYDGVTWSTAGGTTVLGSNFRYVRITLTMIGIDDLSIATISDVRVRLDVKIVHERGTATSAASDANGTYVAFTTPFLDVKKITITPESETPTIFAYNFKDIPDPTGFNVKIWDQNGNRITKPFSYDAEGVR